MSLRRGWSRLTLVLGVLASLLLALGIATTGGGIGGIGSLMALAYVIVLSIGLGREAAADVPRLDARWRELVGDAPEVHHDRRIASFGLRLVAVIAILVLATGLAVVVLRNGWWLIALSLVPAVAVLISRRTQLTARVWAAGVVAVTAMLLIESLARGNIVSGLALALVLAPQVMAGVVLVKASRVARVWLLEGRPLFAARAFALGCLLAVPPALMNVAGMTRAMASEAEATFTSVWMAFYALQPAVLEEGWARLFLLPLLYVTLRSAPGATGGRALVSAVVLSVVIHGLAHAPQSIASVTSAVFTALVYGIPLALLFLRRGLECALGYHFFIDFVRFGYVVLMWAGP